MSYRLLAASLILLILSPSNSVVRAEDKVLSSPHIVFAINEQEYDAKDNLPPFAKAELEDKLKFKCTFLQGTKKDDLPNTAQIAKADLLFIFMRRTELPADQLAAFQTYFNSGKPIVGIRTASHAFQNYLDFDPEILGGHYKGHHGQSTDGTFMTAAEKAADHPILRGLDLTKFGSTTSLYRVLPLEKTASPLLIGRQGLNPPEPVAWTNTYKKSRVFYSSLGNTDDFKNPQFRKLLVNGILWALDRDIPKPDNPPTPAAQPKAQVLKFNLRSRRPSASEPGQWRTEDRAVEWQPQQTALIVCDMWNDHWCKGAAARTVELAPRINAFVEDARQRGAFIIHAPSACMEPYKDHPGRRLAQSAPAASNLPADIANWCKVIPAEEKGKYPIDQADGGCDCTPHCPGGAPWKRQVDTIRIDAADAITDSGVEVWNLLESRGIKNIILMGVHTNMCVLGRPFGLRQLAKNGKTVVLARDLTDTMYNHLAFPYVPHHRGTDLIVEHIEKYICPTISSDQLLAGTPYRFKDDMHPRIVFAISEDLYKTADTLPAFANEMLPARYGFENIILKADAKDPNIIPGFADRLASADLLILSVRRRAISQRDMDALRVYLDSGKPLIAIRTSSHAFDLKGEEQPPGASQWVKFDEQVLGGNYNNHHPDGPAATILPAAGAPGHLLLRGLDTPFTTPGALYKMTPLAPTTQALLVGSIPNAPPEPVAWTNTFGRSKIFYTSLGHPDDFKNASFKHLLANAVYWAVDWPVDKLPLSR